MKPSKISKIGPEARAAIGRRNHRLKWMGYKLIRGQWWFSGKCLDRAAGVSRLLYRAQDVKTLSWPWGYDHDLWRM